MDIQAALFFPQGSSADKAAIGNPWIVVRISNSPTLSELSNTEQTSLLKKRMVTEKAMVISYSLTGHIGQLKKNASGRPNSLMESFSPDLFIEALTDRGISPDLVAMIGSDAESEIGSAKKLGMKGIHVKTGKI